MTVASTVTCEPGARRWCGDGAATLRHTGAAEAARLVRAYCVDTGLSDHACPVAGIVP